MPRLILLFIFPIILPGCTGGEMQDQAKPNVIIILSDDQGWGDFSISGNTNLQTPNIDRMASEGASFNNFYVCPVCSPTRAEMLTGRYHLRGGVYSTSAGGERLDLDETTIAEVFRQAGYATAAYGKWHNGMQYPYHPNGRGFDDYYGFCSGHWGNYFDPMLEHNGRIVQGEGYIINDFTDHGLQFMEDHRDQPFFLYLPFNTPHGPLQVPDEWYDEFENAEIEMRGKDGENEDVSFTRAALAMCENIDWNVGRIQHKIKELGIEEHTILLYFCDNGPNSWRWNGGMKGRKGSVDEGGVRSPLFMTWPGQIKEGKNIEQLAAAIDLLPTLADMAGINDQIEKPLDGISLKAQILNDVEMQTERNIFHTWRGRLSVRNQRFRLDNNGALFDIENDRQQKQDVGADYPEIRQELMLAASEFRGKVLAELPEVDRRPFPIGHPDYKYTQIPARDGTGHGNIQRSNRFPNCSFFTNWTSLEDQITWDVEVLATGDFEVVLYYTCKHGDEGAELELSFGEHHLAGQITAAHDPPLRGMENDRDPRHNSYVKDFKAINFGEIHLEEGTGTLSLKALTIPGESVIDFRLMMFERI